MTQATRLPDWMTRRPDRSLELPREDASVVSLFFQLGTQWRLHPVTGERIGLDNAAIRPTADLAGLDLSPGVFADLGTMEAAALAEWLRTRR